MINQNHLDALIAGLTEYKNEGVIDPWVLADGTHIEPLDVLHELDSSRKALEYAVKIIESYQLDIRNEGLDLNGFCQGVIYKCALAQIMAIRDGGETIIKIERQ